jgi:hypothetical protein
VVGETTIKADRLAEEPTCRSPAFIRPKVSRGFHQVVLNCCGVERHRRHHLKCPHDHVGCPQGRTMLRTEAEKRQGPPGTPEEWFGKSLPLQHTHTLARPHRYCRPPHSGRHEPCVPTDREEFSCRAESTVLRPARKCSKSSVSQGRPSLEPRTVFPKTWSRAGSEWRRSAPGARPVGSSRLDGARDHFGKHGREQEKVLVA